MRITTAAALLALIPLHAGAQAADLAPRPEIVKPVRTELRDGHRTDVIRIKFRDDLPVRLAGDALTDLGTLLLDIGVDRPIRRAAASLDRVVSQHLLAVGRVVDFRSLTEARYLPIARPRARALAIGAGC